MLAPPPPPGFRAYPLDGALLYFHPATGTHVRVATAETRALRRRAPRVAMFGITNACNLRCEFCSRDTTRDSRWTVASAAALLRGLSEAGTLEVAFGGGEPLLFPGFVELLTELRATTPLAMHLTTNGTLVRDALWRRLAGLVGMARISIYDRLRWREAGEVLAAHGQRWGANVLVDDLALPRLPALLAELAVRGCRDVSLLAYVGPDRARQLGAAGDRALARIIADAPLPCRLSVCFGARVPAPRLFDGADHGGDCGAGHDFVAITPDQRLHGCSFQDETVPASTAEEVLHAWRVHQARLAQPSARAGCARRLPTVATPVALPPITVWQAFSGNNSGECVLVSKFETRERAEAFLAELLPGWVPDEPYSAAWQQLFAGTDVAVADAIDREDAAICPRELAAVGSSVLALGYGVDDVFPELRALTWKRGGTVVPGGIHVHDGLTVLAAIRCANAADASAVAARSAHPRAGIYPHGDLVLATLPFHDHADATTPTSLAGVRAWIAELAGDRRFSVELHDEAIPAAELLAVKQRLGHALPAAPRLIAAFWGASMVDEAQAFARLVQDGRVCTSGNLVLVEPASRPKRLAVLAYRHGAYVAILSGQRVHVSGTLWFDAPPPKKGVKAAPKTIDAAALSSGLRSDLREDVIVEPRRHGALGVVQVRVDTSDPAAVMRALDREARLLGCRVRVAITELEPLAWAVRRVIADVT